MKIRYILAAAALLANLEQRFYLKELDAQWRDHLSAMTALRDAVGLRGYGQKDPKQEYKREASQMFTMMQTNIADQVTDMVFRIRIEQEMNTEQLDDALSEQWKPSSSTHEGASAYETEADQGPIGSTPEAPAPIRREEPKVGRNDPCPCGSGKKYKRCHGIEADD